MSDKPNIDERAVEMEDLVYLAPDRPERLRALRERLTEFDKWAADAGVAAERARVVALIDEQVATIRRIAVEDHRTTDDYYVAQVTALLELRKAQVRS